MNVRQVRACHYETDNELAWPIDEATKRGHTDITAIIEHARWNLSEIINLVERACDRSDKRLTKKGQ